MEINLIDKVDSLPRVRREKPATKEQILAIERMEGLGFGLLAVYGWRADRVLADALVAEAYIEAMCAVADLSFQMEEKS